MWKTRTDVAECMQSAGVLEVGLPGPTTHDMAVRIPWQSDDKWEDGLSSPSTPGAAVETKAVWLGMLPCQFDP